MRSKQWLKNNWRIVLLIELGDLCTELAKDSYFDVETRLMFSRIADKSDELSEEKGRGKSAKDT